MIDQDTLRRFGLEASGATFEQLGLVSSDLPRTLSFLDEEKFAEGALQNPNLSGVIVTAELARRLRGHRDDLALIEHEDPRWAYFSLYNHMAELQREEWPSIIAADAQVHPSAFIAGTNVRIGPRTVIGPLVAVLEDVEIGECCVIQAGTVLGSVGFEIKRTSRGLLSVAHDGVVRIGNRVEIGANTCVDKGFRTSPTVVEDDVRIDNLVHVAHGVRIGRGAFVVAGTVLGGSSRIGAEAWLSINASVAPSISIGEGAFVSMGAVATRNVPAGVQVTGNLAIPHDQFIKLFKKWLASLAADETGSGNG